MNTASPPLKKPWLILCDGNPPLGVKNMLIVDKEKRYSFKDKTLVSFGLWEAIFRTRNRIIESQKH